METREPVVELLGKRPGLLLGRPEPHSKLVEGLTRRGVRRLDLRKSSMKVGGQLLESLVRDRVLERRPERRADGLVHRRPQRRETGVEATDSRGEIADQRVNLLEVRGAIEARQSLLDAVEALTNTLGSVT